MKKKCQRFIMKLPSDRLRASKWNLNISISEARLNNELVSISSSQLVRWLDELNSINQIKLKHEVADIRKELKNLRKQSNSVVNRKNIKQLYSRLDNLQFIPDYIEVVSLTKSDFFRACKGFTVNGERYKRLVGTPGGIKGQAVMFIQESKYDEINRRIENDRDSKIKLNPAKLEAYRALCCSGTTPVSLPNGILVVDDCITKFREDVIYITDDNDGEPIESIRKNEEIELNESDGYGLMLPTLAKRWSEELGLVYTSSGFNTRFSWEKGMVFCFDFVDFCIQNGCSPIVKDIWGQERDIRNVELILTSSMLKLWNCYDSLEDYLGSCEKNHYTMGITKNCPEFLENRRDLNYQFIQSYELSDDDIDKLIYPTVNEIEDALSGDYRKAILFLRGYNLTDHNVINDPTFSGAIMANKDVFSDSYVRKKIYQMIKKRIDDAKIGCLSVHGNYSIVSGDPYSLCQHIFGMEVTGLLKKGEIYNKYWSDIGADKVVCFRAPMSNHNNIRLMKPVKNEQTEYWYKYMTTCTLFNSWDSAACALNGMDKDGDLVMLTDNEVLVNNYRETPTIICVQRTAEKKIVTEQDLAKSNYDGFGDDIGKTTNWITSMFDVMAGLDKDSPEYRELEYRVRTGQLYQQNAIDRIKGIIAKPMPSYWHSHKGHPDDVPSETQELNRKIVADKKPYFMIYIYEDLRKQYKKYITNVNRTCLRQFRKTIEELENIDLQFMTDEERDFYGKYKKYMPVGMNDCTVNRICRRVEQRLDGYFRKHPELPKFDYIVMKSGCEYTRRQYEMLRDIYKEYISSCQEYCKKSSNTKVRKENADDILYNRLLLKEEFVRKCYMVSSNEKQLCDLLLDICYAKENTKQLCWDVCGIQIVNNLVEKNGGFLEYPMLDDCGDIDFGGRKFSMRKIYVDN